MSANIAFVKIFARESEWERGKKNEEKNVTENFKTRKITKKP